MIKKRVGFSGWFSRVLLGVLLSVLGTVFGGGIGFGSSFGFKGGFGSDSSFGFNFGFNNTAYAIQNYSLTLSSDTTELNATINALPEGNIEVLTHNLTLSTNNPNGAKLYISSKTNDQTMTCIGGACNAPGRMGDTAIQSATGTIDAPAILTPNTFGFAIAKDSGNNNTMSDLANFSNTNLYTAKNSTAKYAEVSRFNRLFYQSNSTNNNTKIPVYYGVNANSLLESGTYTIDVIYTVVSNSVNESIPEDNNDTLEISPKVIPINKDKTLTITTNIKANTVLENNNIDLKINNKPCTEVNITQNTTTSINQGNNTNQNTDNLNTLTFTCKAPRNIVGKYNATLQITKNNATISNIAKTNGVEYKNIRPMQSITYQDCDNMSEHETREVVDERDEEIYTMAKLKDNKCWMTQNLRLKLSTSKTLTPQDTDLTSNWTPSHTTEVFTTSGGGNGQGSGTNWGSNSSEQKNVRSGYRPDHYNDYGVYYSHSAAVADSARNLNSNGDEAPSSICPKGWRLPKTTTQATNSEFYHMAKHYINSNMQWNTYDNGNGGYWKNGTHNMLQNPLGFLYSGYYYYGSSSLNNIGSGGWWWSSTIRSSTDAYYLGLASSGISPRYYSNRLYGFSVRCLAR